MIRALAIAALGVALVGAIVFWVVTIPATIAANALPAHTPNLANGEVVFNAGGCVSCHAPAGDENRTRLTGGRALKSPFGTFYTPNITQHPVDGIGRWSEADFITAMVKGTAPDGAHYFPAFPYTSYQKMTVADLQDLFAYLKTLPAIAGKARDHDVAFPFNVRRLVGGWKLLFLDGKPFQADPGQSAEWNRGAYLVNGPSHCAECHSPRNALGGIRSEQRFAGGPDPGGEGWVPNITQKALSNWSVKDFEVLLETGQTPDFDSVGGEMAAVVRNTSRLPAGDRTAMAVYLKSLAPIDGPPKPVAKQ